MSIARIRKGITVIVINGNDAGRTGTVKRVNRKDGTAIVEGLNMHKKAVRRTERTLGGLVEMEFPIRLCKLMPYDAESKKGSRVAAAEKTGFLVVLQRAGVEGHAADQLGARLVLCADRMPQPHARGRERKRRHADDRDCPNDVHA